MVATESSIIVVDDERELRELLPQLLIEEGYKVVVVENGLRLISALSLDMPPDLILMDIRMSWINGLELCRSLKSNERFCNIPVAFMSGMTSSSDISRGMACGAVDYFTKPLDIAYMLTRIPLLIAAGHPAALPHAPREFAEAVVH